MKMSTLTNSYITDCVINGENRTKEFVIALAMCSLPNKFPDGVTPTPYYLQNVLPNVEWCVEHVNEHIPVDITACIEYAKRFWLAECERRSAPTYIIGTSKHTLLKYFTAEDVEFFESDDIARHTCELVRLMECIRADSI